MRVGEKKEMPGCVPPNNDTTLADLLARPHVHPGLLLEPVPLSGRGRVQGHNTANAHLCICTGPHLAKVGNSPPSVEVILPSLPVDVNLHSLDVFQPSGERSRAERACAPPTRYICV